MTNLQFLAFTPWFRYLFPPFEPRGEDFSMDHTLREKCDDVQARILNLRDSL